MADPTDPFAHHPELRDKITAPTESFFRTFRAETVFEDKPELHWVLDLLHSDETREASRRSFLDEHDGGDLWVFAYGSLMWDPAFHFDEVRRATLPGYDRRFILKDVYGGRGTRESPGVMAALDKGDGCDGLAFRIAADAVETETEILWRREMIGEGYRPTFVAGLVDGRPEQLLAFVADHAADAISPDLTDEEQVAFIAGGSGFLGTSRDYLANIVRQFDALGIRDSHCTELLRAVDARLASSRNRPTSPRERL